MENFVAPALFMFGILMAGWAFFDWHNARTSATWPAVQGEIVRSVISVPMQRTRRHRWYWHVEYRYAVDLQEYTGWRTHFGCTVPIAVARRIVARFPVQARVAVYHHPSKPGRSVLMPGVNKYSIHGFAIAPVCWAMAWVFWVCLR